MVWKAFENESSRYQLLDFFADLLAFVLNYVTYLYSLTLLSYHWWRDVIQLLEVRHSCQVGEHYMLVAIRHTLYWHKSES